MFFIFQKTSSIMDFMKLAIEEAKKGVKKKEGGPFGAVVVRKGKVIAKAHNLVLKSDATAHAEILAIRKASKKLKSFDLSDCELYTTCEPCPMCYSAIFWARIKEVYFSASRKDARKIGFDDDKLFDILKGKQKSTIMLLKKENKEVVDLFKEFKKSKIKLY